MRNITDLSDRRPESGRAAMLDRVWPGRSTGVRAIPLRVPPPPPSCSPRTAYLRKLIEKAEADGTARKDMTLRLTQGDADLLKRDPGLPVSDVSFAGGVMRFLGVKVEQGGVRESELDISA